MKLQFNLFITKLNKLFNIACYRLASDLNLTNHLDTKNKGFEALIREVKKYTKQEEVFVDLKNQFDEYEKNKLVKEKYEIQIESCPWMSYLRR